MNKATGSPSPMGEGCSMSFQEHFIHTRREFPRLVTCQQTCERALTGREERLANSKKLQDARQSPVMQSFEQRRPTPASEYWLISVMYVLVALNVRGSEPPPRPNAGCPSRRTTPIQAPWTGSEEQPESVHGSICTFESAQQSRWDALSLVNEWATGQDR